MVFEDLAAMLDVHEEWGEPDGDELAPCDCEPTCDCPAECDEISGCLCTASCVCLCSCLESEE